MGRIRAYPYPHRHRLLPALLFCLVAASGWAAPQPPCGNTPKPPWPAEPAQLSLQFWEEAELPQPWQPPACTDWQATTTGFAVLMAASGRLALPQGRDSLLQRLGAVSALQGLRYWSVSRDRWTTLIEEAHALESADPSRARPDFDAAELHPGRDYYYWQREPTTSGTAVYVMRLLEMAPGRLVVSVRNQSPSRRLGITMLEAGAGETLYFFDQLQGDQWGYYQLTRLGHGAHEWLPVTRASYANRAQAVFRHLAGLPETTLKPWRDH